VEPATASGFTPEYDRAIATGKSWREIGTALGQIVKGWERGR
jgi:hypothetical protein